MFAPWINRYHHWRQQRRAIKTLHSFDDRRLADIGTFRDSIELFVAERARETGREE